MLFIQSFLKFFCGFWHNKMIPPDSNIWAVESGGLVHFQVAAPSAGGVAISLSRCARMGAPI